MNKFKVQFPTLIMVLLSFSCQIFNNPETEDRVYPAGAKLHFVKQYINNGLKLLGVSEEYFYDNAGKISRVKNPLATFWMTGAFSDSYQEYNYSDNGLLLSIASYEESYFDSGSFNNTLNIFYQYDDEGNMIREDFDYPDEPDKWGYTLYEYNDSILTQRKVYNSNLYDYFNDSVYVWYTYTYDDNGLLQTMNYFSTDSSLVGSTDYTYENGLKTKEVNTDITTGEITGEHYFFYDVNRNLIKEVYETMWEIRVNRYEYYEE